MCELLIYGTDVCVIDLPEVDIVGTPHDSSYPIHRHICSDRVALSAFNSIRSTTALHQIPEIENVSTTTQPSEWSPSAREYRIIFVHLMHSYVSLRPHGSVES